MTQGMQKFTERATSSESVYLKASEITDTRRLRVIPWISDEKIIPIKFFYEGWEEVIDVKTKKKTSKPIRLKIDDTSASGYEEPSHDVTWARGDYGIQKPQPCFCMIVADYESESIKIFSGTQKTIIAYLLEYIDEQKEKFIKNWNKFELLITKNRDKKFSIERDKLDSEEMPKWITDALEDFRFSYEKFLACEKLEEGDGYSWSDFHKHVDDTPRVESFEPVENWTEIKTPNGTQLGDMSLENLREAVNYLKSKNIGSENKLYRAIYTGINELEAIEGFSKKDIPF